MEEPNSTERSGKMERMKQHAAQPTARLPLTLLSFTRGQQPTSSNTGQSSSRW
jgi:hypothetical protein